MNKLNFSKNFSVLRIRSKMTQEVVAEKLGVSRSAITKWESAGSNPDISMIPIICDCFGVSADELLFGEKSEPGREAKLISLLEELNKKLEKNPSLKERNLYEAYKQRICNIEYNEEEREGYYQIGIDAYQAGNLSDAVTYLDYAAECGSITAIRLAIQIREDILQYSNDDANEYFLQVSEFAKKVQQYGEIIEAVLEERPHSLI